MQRINHSGYHQMINELKNFKQFLCNLGHILVEFDIGSVPIDPDGYFKPGTYLRCVECDYIFCLLDGENHTDVWHCLHSCLPESWNKYTEQQTCKELIIKSIIK